MASPKITRQGASFPEDPPGTPKLQPGDGGDRSARVQQAREDGTLDDETGGLPHARPGEEGERFRSLDNPAQDVIQREDDVPEQRSEGDTEPAEVEPETYEGDAWTGEALRSEASKRSLSTSGTKAELAARLREHDQASSG
jgi:SAP domain